MDQTSIPNIPTIKGWSRATLTAGAQVVVDVANAPSWEDQAVLEFFEKSGRNLLAAEPAAGVGHHVALSVVGKKKKENACSPAAISARNWLRRISSRPRRFPTPSFAPRSSSSS